MSALHRNGLVQTALALWVRLAVGLSAAGLLSLLLYVLGEIDGWLHYQSTFETILQIAQLVIATIAISACGATLLSILAVAIPGWKIEAIERRAHFIRRWTVVAGLTFFTLVFWRTFFYWTADVGIFGFPFTPKYSLWLVLVLVTVIWASRRPDRLDAADSFLTEGFSRRAVIGSGLSAAALAAIGAATSKGAPALPVPSATSARLPNIILVTFDALSAEDMSLYGYGLPTTPNIDAFAKSASVFTNFYSASTWTTPCVASMQTGRYPTNTRVFQNMSGLKGESAQKSLVSQLRAAGYQTAASVANVAAYPPHIGLAFDIVPKPPINDLISPPILFNDTLSVQIRIRGILESQFPIAFSGPESRFPPELSFK